MGVSVIDQKLIELVKEQNQLLREIAEDVAALRRMTGVNHTEAMGTSEASVGVLRAIGELLGSHFKTVGESTPQAADRQDERE
jgi:hypothetical protein